MFGLERSAPPISRTHRSINMPATLYERLGGEERIKRLIADVIDNHYANPLIRARFANTDRSVVERHAVEFLCSGSGGPQCYTGKDLVSAHKGMNISEQELVATIDDFVAAMIKNGYDQAEKNEVVAILYSLKGDVVRL
jgi:hemoglobin